MCHWRQWILIAAEHFESLLYQCRVVSDDVVSRRSKRCVANERARYGGVSICIVVFFMREIMNLQLILVQEGFLKKCWLNVTLHLRAITAQRHSRRRLDTGVSFRWANLC